MEKKYYLIALVVMLLAAAAGWFVTQQYLSPTRQFQTPLIELKGDATAGGALPSPMSDDGVTVKIFLPSADGIKVDERRIQNNPIPVAMAEALTAEYLKGLKDEIKDVKLLGVYRDKRSIIYIDVSDEFRKNFSGDIKQEYALLKSLYQTITVNIPGTEDVRLLVDGKEIESLGGHFNALYPLGNTVRDELQQPLPPDPKTS
ncbi:MAG: GerMN domain-containing protein [Nitrospirae bacterium]|nr:GerMN domain-containing protein [Nitrospirota bacterium]